MNTEGPAMKKVQVLLSAYNGEKYLEEQVNSILTQDYKKISLLIRDDGSTDRTPDILRRYAGQYENVAFYTGENIGTAESFLDLMRYADITADFYAFSDQDDVWLPEKIRQAVMLMEQEDADLPLLYASQIKLVNENLEEIPVRTGTDAVVPDFGNALVENICAGCTEVFNRALLGIVHTSAPEYMVMHDWWMYLCASCFGKVLYDPHAYILYRQHGDNQVGIARCRMELWKSRIRRFFTSGNLIRRQAQSFVTVYGNQNEKCGLALWLAKEPENRKERWQMILSHKIYRQRKLDDMIYRFLFALGLL